MLKNRQMDTNEDIKKQDIIESLIWDDSIDDAGIKVEVQNNTAILEGTVPTYVEKIAAKRDALLIPGITDVDNNLGISFPAEFNLPSDAEITDSIERKLLWDSRINSTNIRVQTTDGVVTLSGVTDTYWEKNLVEDLALSSNGVVGIINDLTISLSKSVVDLDIENDIKAIFRRSLFIDEDTINVNVENGIVTLSGAAPDNATKIRAHDIAMYTTGVIDVINDIRVV